MKGLKRFFERMIFLDEQDDEIDKIQKFLNTALLITSLASILTSLLLLAWLILT